MSLVRCGLSERVRSGGLVGESLSPADRLRAGAPVVLVAWAIAVVAGCAFAKASEHFLTVAAPGALATARAAYVLAVVAGACGATAVVAGAGVALPATVRLLRSGGWATVRGPVRWAAAVTVTTTAALMPLAWWAHHLDPAQRNGAYPAYAAAFVLWTLLATASIVLGGGAAVAVARKVDLGAGALRIEAVLAAGVAVSTAALTVAVALWWTSLARVAPWFLGGTAPGSHSNPWTVEFVVVEGLLIAALAVAAFGVVRMERAWSALPWA
jgi:hypothetical protein